jgi:hypothetical protein
MDWPNQACAGLAGVAAAEVPPRSPAGLFGFASADTPNKVVTSKAVMSIA